jgi:hypothetical protein
MDDVMRWDRREKYQAALLVVCAALHVGFVSVGWNHTLSDVHGFRQAQTAISTYYTVKEGFCLDYITPVLGKPWSIPMEFPLFQWVTAVVVKATGMGLDRAGRLMSLVFFYLSFVPLYVILKHMVQKKRHIPVFFCIILASPTYIFWSRTFMIESLALFLSLVYVAAIVSAVARFRWGMLAFACAAGTLAGLTKVTTFGLFVISTPIIVYLCGYMRAGELAGLPKARWKKLVTLLVVAGVPLAVSAWWVHHTDAVKSLNPLARDFITSHALRAWNFGGLGQRLELGQYGTLGRMALQNLSWPLVAFVMYLVLMVAGGRLRTQAVWLLVCFLIGPAIFFNLYRHDYYWYANGMLLMLSVGFLVVAVMDDERFHPAIRTGVLPLVILLMVGGYLHHYYPRQQQNHDSLLAACEAAKAATNEGDILLIYGYDWSSEVAYYAQRKAVMVYRPLSDAEFAEVLEQLGGEKIGAMVVGGDMRQDAQVIAAGARRFGFVDVPAFRGAYLDVYPKKF